MFILDDATPFEVKRSEVEKLPAMLRYPVEILDGAKLAKEMPKPPAENPNLVLIGAGGVLTYCLLRKEGFEADYGYVEPKRTYDYPEGKRPVARVEIPELYKKQPYKPKADGPITFLDDVVASAKTLGKCMDWVGSGNSFNSMSLVLSREIRSENKMRMKGGSTISGVDNAYTSQTVRGVDGMPAILSLRFILLKCRGEGNANYLMDYVGDDFKPTIMDFIQSIDIGQLKFLYKDTKNFIKYIE